MQKERIIQQIESLSPQERLKPSQLADMLGINRNTCKHYLDTMPDVFPHKDLTDTDYRLYDVTIARRLCLFKAMKTRPMKLLNAVAIQALQQAGEAELWNAYKKSASELERVVRSFG